MNSSTPQKRRNREAARFAGLRSQMVEEQIRQHGINDPRLCSAMLQVPREVFVPEAYRDDAYGDWPLPIGYRQTISQPLTVAYMVQALRLEGTERVLEVGTGSGYGAAVLACLADEVHTVERIPDLGEAAGLRLKRLGYHNVQVHIADGTLGLAEYAPFDAIVVTAGAETLPEPYREQIADGGRIVIPIGEFRSQFMYRFTRQGSQLKGEELGGFAFVPLIGQHGWRGPAV